MTKNKNKKETRSKDKKPTEFPSSTGLVYNVPVDQTTWRRKLQTSRIKFDDVQKKIYLDALASHGLKGRAAKAAGVSMMTVRDHVENDPDFMEALGHAVVEYRDMFVEHAMKLALEGEIHQQFDKDGNMLAEKRVFPIPLITLELRRIEPGYRDKQTIDLNTSGGGVLVAPAEQTPEEWITIENEANQEKLSPDEKKAADAAELLRLAVLPGKPEPDPGEDK